MKQNYLLIACICILFSYRTAAQTVHNYQFHWDTSSVYVPLDSNSSQVTVIQPYGGGIKYFGPRPIGFSFQFADTVFQSLVIGPGWVNLGRDSVAPTTAPPQTLPGPFGISALAAGLIFPKDSSSKILCQVSGSGNQRKLTIEWRRYYFPNSNTSELNMQLELHETKGIIAARYGPITPATSIIFATFVGLRGRSNDCHLRKAPTPVDWTKSTLDTGCSGQMKLGPGSQYPSSKLTYWFAPQPPAGVETPAAGHVQLRYIPGGQDMQVILPEANAAVLYQVCNIMGQVVHSGRTERGQQSIDLGAVYRNLPGGTYLFQLSGAAPARFIR